MRIDMSDSKTRAIVVVAAFILSFFMLKIGADFLVNCVANRAIEKIRQDYSPSRYGPGIDTDKLDVDIQKKR